jgi:hypothetical protein
MYFALQNHHAWACSAYRRRGDAGGGQRASSKARGVPGLFEVNADGMRQGMLCLHDIAFCAEEARGKHVQKLSYDEAMSTLKALCEHRAAKVAARVKEVLS